MTSPLAGIRWLRDGINLGGRNPRTLLGAVALVIVCGLVPTIFTTALQFLFPNNMPVMFGAFAFSLLIGLALSPMFAGLLQVIHAIESGQPARALGVFAPYRTGVWKPVIGFTLLMWVEYALAFGVVLLAAGSEVRTLYADMYAAAAAGVQYVPPTQTMPSGFVRLIVAAGICALLIGSIWAIGYGQVAIARRGVLASMVDGIVGTFKNVPALIVLVLAAILLSIVLVIVFLIVAAVLGVIGKLVGDWLALVLLVPLYIAFALGAYVVMFGLVYAMWRDICAE